MRKELSVYVLITPTANPPRIRPTINIDTLTAAACTIPEIKATRAANCMVLLRPINLADEPDIDPEMVLHTPYLSADHPANNTPKKEPAPKVDTTAPLIDAIHKCVSNQVCNQEGIRTVKWCKVF
jgi:hypothetical protein